MRRASYVLAAVNGFVALTLAALANFYNSVHGPWPGALSLVEFILSLCLLGVLHFRLEQRALLLFDALAMLSLCTAFYFYYPDALVYFVAVVMWLGWLVGL